MGQKRRVKPSEVFEKIRVDSPDQGFGGETLWAVKLAPDLYVIRNIPFSAYNLNRYDQVVATTRDEHLEPVVRRVAEPGGHKTFRVIFTDKGFGERDGVVERLSKRGCTFEGLTPRYIAIDVPPELSVLDVEEILEPLQADGILEYENCATSTPEKFDGTDSPT